MQATVESLGRMRTARRQRRTEGQDESAVQGMRAQREKSARGAGGGATAPRREAFSAEVALSVRYIVMPTAFAASDHSLIAHGPGCTVPLTPASMRTYRPSAKGRA